MTAFPKGTTTEDVNPKKGDKFRSVVIGNNFPVGDVLTFDKPGGFNTSFFINQDGKRNWTVWHNLEPLETRTPTWETLQEGDVLENSGRNYDLTVQGKLGTIVFYIRDDNPGSSYKDTIERLKSNDWRVKSTTRQPKKMTVSEVEKALGHEVEIVEG